MLLTLALFVLSAAAAAAVAAYLTNETSINNGAAVAMHTHAVLRRLSLSLTSSAVLKRSVIID
jgi:hypothetical protein